MSDPRFNRLRDYQRAGEEQALQPAPSPNGPVRTRRFRWRYVLIPLVLILIVLPLGRQWIDPVVSRLHAGLRQGGAQQADRNARPLQVQAPAPAEQIQLEVVNNCGVDGLGSRTAKFLRDRRFDVAAFSTGAIHSPLTLVIDRLGNRRAARLVAQSLGLPESRVRRAVDSSLFLHCTVIIGADYKTLTPFSGNGTAGNISEQQKN